MRLGPDVREELRRAAKTALPNEACGLVGAREGELAAFIACRNAAGSPRRYAIAPEEVLAALKEFDRLDMELGAIFHSHPAGPAYPSPTDVAEAAQGVLQLILGAPPDWTLRSFWIDDARVREEPIEAG